MTNLVQNLKRLKGAVKVWEKRKKEKQRKELVDMELESQHLFSLFPSAIFLETEVKKLASIKLQRDNYYLMRFLLGDSRVRTFGLIREMLIQKISIVFPLQGGTITLFGNSQMVLVTLFAVWISLRFWGEISLLSFYG